MVYTLYMDITRNALTYSSNSEVYERAFELLAEDLREGITSGEYFITEPRLWHEDDRPVVKRVKNGTLVKGSGRMAGVKEMGDASREGMFKRRKGYRRMIEDLIPASDTRDNQNAIMSFKELVENLVDACLGSPQTVRCTSCGDKFQTALKKDAATLYKLFENLNGKAKETQEINLSSQHLSLVLNERTPVNEIVVRELSPHMLEERRTMVIEHE